MSEDLVRRRRTSPAPVSLPDGDDILREILVRLPPLPSSLPRASLVCKRWRRLVSDPRFHRQFCAHHRDPPLLGFFIDKFGSLDFTPTLEPPDRVPAARLSLKLPREESWRFLGCRRGVALLLSRTRHEISVWNPITGDQRRVALPPDFSSKGTNVARHAALVCEGTSKQDPFRVVLLRCDHDLTADRRVFATLYDSEIGEWVGLCSTSIQAYLCSPKPSILVGNSVCWLLLGYGNYGGILEFDLGRKSLAVIKHPESALATGHSKFQILRMEDSKLGLAISSHENNTIQLWERKANSVGANGWMLQKTIQLEQLLSLKLPCPTLLGYDEDGHVIFVWTAHGVFMIQLKSMQSRNLFKSNLFATYHPLRSFYTAGAGAHPWIEEMPNPR